MMKRKNTMETRNAAPAAARTSTSRGRRAPKGVLRRLLKTLFEFYPVLLPVTPNRRSSCRKSSPW